MCLCLHNVLHRCLYFCVSHKYLLHVTQVLAVCYTGALVCYIGACCVLHRFIFMCAT